MVKLCAASVPVKSAKIQISLLLGVALILTFENIFDIQTKCGSHFTATQTADIYLPKNIKLVLVFVNLI